MYEVAVEVDEGHVGQSHDEEDDKASSVMLDHLEDATPLPFKTHLILERGEAVAEMDIDADGYYNWCQEAGIQKNRDDYRWVRLCL